MAREVLTLTVDLTRQMEQVAAAAESVRSARSAIASHGSAQRRNGAFPDASMLFDDPADLLRCELVDRTAGGASKLECFEIQPSDRYVELVSAIAADRHEYTVRIRHGWPILSVVGCTATVAEAGGVTSALGGGAAA